MYPSWISRSLCSAGIVRCIKPLAQSRNETNSSWVNGADKSGFIFQICASGAAVQARFVCHNQTDPLPLSERDGPNTAQIDDFRFECPSAPSGPASRFLPHRLFPSQLHLQTEATCLYGGDSRRNGLATAPASKALWPNADDPAQKRRQFAPGYPGSAQLRPWSRRSRRLRPALRANAARY